MLIEKIEFTNTVENIKDIEELCKPRIFSTYKDEAIITDSNESIIATAKVGQYIIKKLKEISITNPSY